MPKNVSASYDTELNFLGLELFLKKSPHNHFKVVIFVQDTCVRHFIDSFFFSLCEIVGSFISSGFQQLLK